MAHRNYLSKLKSNSQTQPVLGQVELTSENHYRQKIKKLTDRELLKSTKNLVTKEQKLLSILIFHLREIEDRKLYSDLKYPSLYEYCIYELKYSEAQAYRRISAMRLTKEVPILSKKISDGSISLTNINLVSSFLRDNKTSTEDKKQLIELASNKTKRECEQELTKLRLAKGIPEKPRRTIIKPDTSQTVRVNVSLKHDTVTKIHKIKSYYAHKKLEIPDVIDKMADAMIVQYDKNIQPKRRPRVTEPAGRFIPKNLKAKVIRRDNGVCQLCGSIYALEIDHIVPYAKGGKTELSNLRLLCRNCNLRAGIKEFGKEKMKR